MRTIDATQSSTLRTVATILGKYPREAFIVVMF